MVYIYFFCGYLALVSSHTIAHLRFGYLMRLGIKQFIASGPEHPDPHEQQNSANNKLCTVFETQMTVMMIDVRGFLTLFIRNQNDKVRR